MSKPFKTIVPALFQRLRNVPVWRQRSGSATDPHLRSIGPTRGRLAPDFRSQAENVFTTLEAILKEAGATLDDVASLHSYHVGDLHSRLRELVDVKASGTGRHTGWTGVGVTQIGVPGGAPRNISRGSGPRPGRGHIGSVDR